MNHFYRWGLFALIFLSGTAGLIYEVVWHRYLAILLGAHARATAVVLAIFLGGIAAGYATFGRWTRWKAWDLLRTYCIVELGLFVWAAFFPLLFRLLVPVTGKLYGFMGINNLLIDLFVSVVLIGFPTFLMGGTLPLLTQGMAEDLKTASHTHAKIYGINTLGACFGCLGAGYFLIPNIGLIGANWFAGILNLMVAVIGYLLYARHFGYVQVPDKKMSEKKAAKRSWTEKLFGGGRDTNSLLVIGFLSGFYLITLQTVLIRLVGLSTGSSNYNFALVVSIFIFALGMGSLLARRIATYTAGRLFWNQMGVCAGLFALYLTGAKWSYWGHVIRVMFRDMPEAFFPYQASLGLMFLLLFLVPVGLAGLTLPLCFHLLKDRKESLGYRVGQLYGLNALGCVCGALIGGYFLLNFFNLDELFKISILMVLLAASFAGVIYVNEESSWQKVRIASVSGLSALVLFGVFLIPLYPKERFIQPFRQTQSIPNVTFAGAQAFGKYLGRNTEYVVYKDGPNTSVGVGSSKYQGKETSRTIFINGKSDGNTAGDFFTTVILAHLPGLLAPSTENTLVIGFGTGITTSTIGMYEGTKNIDVAEISGTVIQKSSEFDAYNNSASKNPKVKFHEMDAFRFLGGSKKTFDVIISEPSNPWVAGVENLFSHEFYQATATKLSRRGMFVQWIHTYSFSDDLLRMVFRTMRQTYPFVSVFQLRAGDLALVATRDPIDRADLKRGALRMEQQPVLKSALNATGITGIETLLALELVTPPLTEEMSETVEPHTLELPRLSNEAARAFFAGTSADLTRARRTYKGYLSSIKESLLVDYLDGNLASTPLLHSFKQSFCEHNISRVNSLCEEAKAALRIRLANKESESGGDVGPSARELATLTEFTKHDHKRFTAADLQVAFEMFEAYKKFYSPVAFIPIEPVIGRLDRCMIQTPRTEELFGECLLQKILVFEAIYGRGAEFKEHSALYLEWFDTLSTKASNYEKLKQARDILLNMASLK